MSELSWSESESMDYNPAFEEDLIPTVITEHPSAG